MFHQHNEEHPAVPLQRLHYINPTSHIWFLVLVICYSLQSRSCCCSDRCSVYPSTHAYHHLVFTPPQCVVSVFCNAVCGRYVLCGSQTCLFWDGGAILLTKDKVTIISLADRTIRLNYLFSYQTCSCSIFHFCIIAPLY